jgi:CheY-like chemotaxis protein
MYILLVEDEDPKRRHIESFVRKTIPDVEMTTVRSVRSALDALEKRIPDLVILDMSLPTFDIGGDEGGGRPQGFGGIELLRNMELEGVECPVVVLTGYEAFAKAGGQVGLDTLSNELFEAHPSLLRGMFHFNSAYGDWQERLSKVIAELNTVSQ